MAYMGKAAFKKALEIARDLRRNGHICYIDFSEGRLKSQMRLADKLKAKYVLIIGDEELSRGRYAIKRLSDSKQWEVSADELREYLGEIANL